MKWPEFAGEIYVAGSEPMFQLVLQEKFLKPLNEAGLKVVMVDMKKENILPNGGFLYSPAWYHFFISENFIQNEYALQSALFLNFVQELTAVFEMSSNIFDG